MDATPVMVRIQPDLLSALDSWIEKQPDPKPSRPEAIRHMIAATVSRGRRNQDDSK